MSDENVEIVRRSLEAYQAGDITASVVDVDPEVEFDSRKESGVEIDQLVFQLFRLRRGKVIHWKLYLDRAEALEAAGLSE
jgi:ketosteroid isomerase-like protein